MATKNFIKSSSNRGYLKNMEVVGYNDMDGIMPFQPAMQKVGEKYYIYWGSFKGAGWHIMDVTDPTDPKIVKWMPIHEDPNKYPGQCCNKVQVADGLLLCSLGGGLPHIVGGNADDNYISGLHIYDVKTDPENPRLLSHWDTGCNNWIGVHRFFYNGGRYVHLSAECPGFCTPIYRILDIIDPEHPIEVGRWWMPEQYIDAMTEEQIKHAKEHLLDLPGLHGPPYVVGSRAYLSYSGAGAVILDISEISRPQLLGRLNLMPPFAGPNSGARCHTFMPITGRPYAVATNEGERFYVFDEKKLVHRAQPMNNLHMIDIRDPQNPTLIAEFPYPEVPKDYPWDSFNECGLGMQGPFGPHNLHEPHGLPWCEDDPNRIYCCYFHAGMRVYDISNPYIPKEIAYFIPPNPEKFLFGKFPGPLLGSAEDCVVDDRGYIYMGATHDGVYVLKCLV